MKLIQPTMLQSTLQKMAQKKVQLLLQKCKIGDKGRRGKTWISPPGGVWMSIILRPDIPPSKAPLLTLVTGVAVAETLKDELMLDVGIKWPNDIIIGNKKVCGILTEVNASINKVNYVVVGIGIDMNVDVPVFPPDLQKGATSLKNELDTEINGALLVQKFLLKFEKHLQ